eukprot:CAMPEP_0176064226 /NCGR_PEP_ID=MMETSP0120_2-20121206/32033_1 /TAXON_ID=160619 /ORGANISM="Kryptoperidinium foliaceum, Strain CCMP 1326" /LENGTH=253 /DNA_ID=CAMNT_0017397799 /DNA_START=324 /DNA_END=1081 /DNA_ORIENTATION=+
MPSRQQEPATGLAEGVSKTCGSTGRASGRLACPQDQGALPPVLVHHRLLIIGDPESTCQDLDTSIVNFFPAVEAAALAHRTDTARAHVVHVVEKHLVPTVTPPEQGRHRGMQLRPSTVGVRRQELVPQVGMVEVRDEHPGQGEADPHEARHPEHEPPSFTQRPPQAQRTQKPHARPEGEHEEVVLQAHREPLVPETLVALAAWAPIRELRPPEDSEDAAVVMGADEVPEGDQRHREPAIPLEGPLLQGVEPVR